MLELKQVAKGNVFNDERGGIVNSVMGMMSKVANKSQWSKAVIMPYFMFFRILGNIGDFMIDTIPAYGMARRAGYTPTTISAHITKYRRDGLSFDQAVQKAIFGKRLSVSELPRKTAMLGDQGSWRSEQQRKRAMFGNVIMLTQLAMVAGLWDIGVS